MDRKTSVTLWREVGAGVDGAGATGRLIEAFATAVEAAERERCAVIARKYGRVDGGIAQQITAEILGPNVKLTGGP